MSKFEQLNLNLFRVFHTVYETSSMTEAARRLHLTQSGVSQHIKTLESELGVVFFDRVQKKLVPTTAAKTWYEATHENFDRWISLWQKSKTGTQDLQGVVRIGMPTEFGTNIVLSKLATFSKKHPGVQFQIEYDFVSAMNTALLDGKLDFAFVDDFRMDTRIEKTPLYRETHDLCTTDEKLIKPRKQDRDYFESLRYVDYQPDSSILAHWFQHHFKFKNMGLRVVASVMSVQGIARLIQEGVGVGILPRHQIERLKQAGVELYIFKGSEKPLVNPISLAALKGRTQTRAAQAAEDFLTKSF